MRGRYRVGRYENKPSRFVAATQAETNNNEMHAARGKIRLISDSGKVIGCYCSQTGIDLLIMPHLMTSRISRILRRSRVFGERGAKGSLLVNAIRGNESRTRVPRSAKICEPSHIRERATMPYQSKSTR